VNPSPFGHQKGLMSGDDRQCSPGIALGHSVVFSDANRVQFNHEFGIVLPTMNVGRLMIARVDPHLEAVISKNRWHGEIIIEPLGFCQSKSIIVKSNRR
jgi:hypothetical protein